MPRKKLVLFLFILIFLISPYIIWAPAVLVFLVPLIYALYQDKWQFIYHLFVLLSASLIALMPLIFYEWEVFAFGVLIATVFLFLFCLACRYSLRHFKNTHLAIFLPAFCWMSLYYLFNFKHLLTPAFDVGNLLPMSSPLIWFSGSIGITFLVLIFNSALAYFLAKKDKFALILSVFLIFIFTSCFIYSNVKNPKVFSKDKRPISVALIQGNFNHPWEWSQDNLSAILKRYEYLTQWAIKGKPDFILWPEYTLVVDLVKENSKLRDELKDFIASMKTPFIIGSIIYEEPRPWHQDVGLIFDQNGRLLDYYSSASPAPFNMFTSKSKNALKTFEAPFYSNPLTRSRDKFGLIVCWEETNASLVRKYAKLQAAYLVSLSNDQNLDRSWLMRAASYYTRSRAAENQRYLVRATNTGVSQVISPTGKIISRLPPQKMGFLYGTIYAIHKNTFYTKYGDILTKFGLLFILLIMVTRKISAYIPKT